MLTLNHLETYKAFDGDVDAWARAGGTQGMTDDDWAQIDELRQGLHLISSGLASEDFAAGVERRLMESTEGEAVRSMLRALNQGSPDNSPQAR